MIEVLGNVALWPAQQLINTVIQGDAHVQDQLRAFSGKAIQINPSSPALPLRIVVEDQQLRLTAIDSQQYALEVDATIRGPVSKLLEQLFAESPRQPLVGGEVEVEGDVQLVQDLLAAVKYLDIDWQDHLSPVLGDVFTHQLGQALTGTRAWATGSADRVHASIDDYLKEEAKLFPHEQALRNFQDDLDAIKLRLDRIHARVDRLRKNLSALEAGPTG